MQLAVGLAGGMGEVGGINGIMMSASKFGQASPTAKPTIDSLPDKVGNFGVSIHAAHTAKKGHFYTDLSLIVASFDSHYISKLIHFGIVRGIYRTVAR
jgi:hypothetical protein